MDSLAWLGTSMSLTSRVKLLHSDTKKRFQRTFSVEIYIAEFALRKYLHGIGNGIDQDP